MSPRRRTAYFQRAPGSPAPMTVTVSHRVQFREADIMGVLWHGRYLALFEEAATELRRRFGMGYPELHAAALQAPIVQARVDYHRPLLLDESARVAAHLIWNEAARLDIEYEVFGEDGQRAATGFTVQMFVDAIKRQPYVCSPELLCRCRARWLHEAAGTKP
jgi:acyl-CoA thioester hydrolase